MFYVTNDFEVCLFELILTKLDTLHVDINYFTAMGDNNRLLQTA